MPEKYGEATSAENRSAVVNEAALIWDEYKYRHDLIWRHLIRSTVAVVAMITVEYSNAFVDDPVLTIVSGVLAALFSAYNLLVINAELKHYWRVRDKHSEYQRILFGLAPDNEQQEKFRGFGGRVNFYLIFLVLFALGATLYQVWPPEIPWPTNWQFAFQRFH